MSKLILHPTDLCQWHALINEAQAASSRVLNEETESYLVFLLMRFSMTTDWLESVIALDYLESTHHHEPSQIKLMREVGDKSLLFSGLFPDLARRRRVSLDYYINMGRSAYQTVSELQTPDQALLYVQLSNQFINMQVVLQSIRMHGCHSMQHDATMIDGSSPLHLQ
jgi:hypothetical protein